MSVDAAHGGASCSAPSHTDRDAVFENAYTGLEETIPCSTQACGPDPVDCVGEWTSADTLGYARILSLAGTLQTRAGGH